MFKGRKLKILTIYVLVCCFLVNNLIFIASSEASNANTNENTTKEPSGYSETSYEAQTESFQSSETEIQESTESSPSDGTIENPQPEVSGTLETTGGELSDIQETEGQEAQTPDSSQEQDPELETGQEGTIDTEGNTGNTGNVDPENKVNNSEPEDGSENKTYEPTEVSTGASAESEKSSQSNLSEERETESSHHKSSGTSQYRVKKAESQVKNEVNAQTEPLNPDLSKASREAPPSASVNLHGEKTDVIAGEDILLKLSAVNLITRPVMHVQVIIIPPSGLSVSSSEFVQSGAGQYTTTYELEPGQGRDIEVRIETNQPGNFTVQGRVVYYYGKNTKNVEDYTLELPITVKDETDFYREQMPGFKFASLIFSLIAVFIVRRIK